jgi:hypothetical protein
MVVDGDRYSIPDPKRVQFCGEALRPTRGPTKKQLVLEEVGKVIEDALGPSNVEMMERLRKRLEANAGLTSLLR